MREEKSFKYFLISKIFLISSKLSLNTGKVSLKWRSLNIKINIGGSGQIKLSLSCTEKC